MNEPEEPIPDTDTTKTWTETNAEERSTQTVDPVDAMKRVALAGIGAITVASEVTDEVFSELVKRGEKTADEAMREIKQVRERRAERRADASTYVRARMDSILNRLNLPSKGDVDSINAKLNILTRKVDDVQAGQVDSATGVYRSSTGTGTGTPGEPPPA